MPQTTKHHHQQHQQQQIIQHTSHKTIVTAANSQLHQQHVQQVHLANSTVSHQQIQYHNPQQQMQSGQQQAHMIQVSEEFLEQTQVQTQSHTTAAANMMISATGEVIQQQQIFKIVSTDAATGNVIIDTSAGNQNINTSTTSKVLLSNLTVLSKQQAAAAGVTGQQQSAVPTAQTINFVNAKHVYTASSAANPASAATLCKQQKFSVTATNLGGNFKTTSLKQSTNSPQYVQQISGGIGGQQKINITSGNRNTQMLTTTARIQAGSCGASTVSNSGALSTTPNTAQTMVLQQPHKFLTATNTTTKSTLGPGGNVIKKTTGTLRMSNSNSTAAKLMNNLHTTQGVKTFITQTTSSAQLQHQQHQQQPQNALHPQQLCSLQQQHHVKGGSKSKFVKQYTNAIINSAGAVAIATLPHQQHNQNISLNSSQQPHHQQLQNSQSGYINHHHKTAMVTAGIGSATKINKINSKYATANVAAQLPPGTQLHQKTALSQTSAQTQQYQTQTSNNNNSNIKFVNAQGTIIQQQSQQPLIPHKIHIKQQQHHTQYQSMQHFDAVDGGCSGNNLYTTLHHQSANAAAGSASTTAANSALSDEIMMVNGTQMTDELSARILQSMSQKSFNNQRYQQQHLVPKSSSSNMLPPPPTTNSAVTAVTHLQNASNNHSNILLSPGECILYPPAAAVIGTQQQSLSTHAMLAQPSLSSTNNFNNASSAAGSLSASITNYMTVSNSNMTTITPHSGLVSSSSVSNGTPSSSSSRQAQSVPNSRSQSMERKLHESSMSRKSTEYYKVKIKDYRQKCTFVAPTAATIYATTSSPLVTSSLIDFIIPLPSCTSLTTTNTLIASGTITTPAATVVTTTDNTTHNTTNMSNCATMTTTLLSFNNYHNSSSNNNSLRGSHSNLAATVQSAHIGAGNIAISSSLATSMPSALMGMQGTSSPLPPKQPSLPSQVVATIEPQAQVIHLQASKTLPDASNFANDNDDIIGEEIRPLPVDTNDIRLQILHSVILDHTYANAMPSELPTTFAVQLPPLSQSIGSNTAPAAGNNSSIHSQPLHWSLGGIGAVSATAATVANNGAHGVVATSNYSIYSSQLSRLQQDEDSYTAISCSTKLPVGDIDPGEETETAPEAEAEDDSITRCICDLTHDDGYMICCDKCCAWQHVDCMGIDRQNIPDEYLCELCQPRPVDKGRARALQVQKRKEQNQLILAQAQAAAAAGTMGAAGSASGNGGAGVSGVSSLLPNDVLAAQQRLTSGLGGFNVSGSGNGEASAMQHLGPGGSNLKKGSKILKKIKDSGTGKKSKKSDKLATTASGLSGKAARKETKKNTKRKKGTHDGSSTAGMTAAEKHAANLRQWIENYELAVTNHYSPELRARLHAITKQPSLLQSILNTENPVLKEFSLGNLENRATTVPHAGGKILISNLDIGPNSPICELRGKYMLTTQYKTQNTAMNMNTPPPNNYHVASYKAHKTPGPFIFFYKLQGVEVTAAVNQQGISQTTTTTTLNPDGTFTTTTTTLPAQLSPPPTYLKGPEICVDTRTYGNEARFVRRSCRPNAEIQHLFEKGTIHLFIVALTDIRASTEITIRHEPHDIVAVENKRSNVMVIQPTSTQCACGLIKDCIFGPPIPPQLPPAAKSNAGRKSLALNGGGGGSSNTGNLTAKQRKVNQQNLNRNRSTSSSGDSNMGGVAAQSAITPTPPVTVALGQNSPNNLLVGPKINKNAVVNVNNSTALLPLTASCSSNASNGSSSSCVLTNIIHDSGICTSSSSPSVSIPSPTQNMHSPIQHILQQQHQQQHLRPAHILPQQQQHQLMQSLPTPLILTTDTQQQPHQVLIQSPQATPIHLPPQQQQQQPQQQPLCVIAQAASPISSQMKDNDPQKEQRVTTDEALFITTQHQQLLSPQQHLLQVPPIQTSPVLEALEGATPAASVPQSINSTQSLTNTPVVTTAVAQQSEEVAMHTADVLPEPIITPSENQALLEPLAASAPISSHSSPTCATSPHQQKSPQKSNQTTSHQSNQPPSGRKTPAKHSRTTSFSEDNEHHHNDENSVVTTPNSSSTPKEKPKLSREDRKMEAILRAIEKMERGSQRQKPSKKQNSSSHNTTPTSPNKTFDSADSSTGGTNKRSNSQSAGGSSRTKKKRKAGNRAAANNNQRKRRQSRINSQESIDGSGPHENDTVTSESDGCAVMHSPPTQSVAQLNHSTEASTVAPTGESVNNNVDQAAGLLMAFANPLQVAPSEAAEEPPIQSPKRLPQFTISSSSPNEVTASPPPTPPSQVSSACLLIEAAVGPLETNLETNSGDTNNDEFKYPPQAKTKKLLMNNWLHQEEETSAIVGEPLDQSAAASHLMACGVTGGLDSLVQAAMSDFKQSETEEAVDTQPQNLSMVAQRVEEFLQLTEGGSPTPPPTKHSYEYEQQQQQLYAMSTPAVDLSVRNHSVPAPNPPPPVSKNFHLPLQVSTCSNNSSVKKRWLRQAISEESHEESQSLCSTSPSPATTPVIAVQSFGNPLQLQTVPPPAVCSSPAVTNHIPNGFTTPLKKRRLLLADNDDILEDNLGQCSADSNLNTPSSPAPYFVSHNSLVLQENEVKPQEAKQSLVQELQEDIDVDVEKCEVHDTPSLREQQITSSSVDLEQDVNITSPVLKEDITKTEVIKHGSDNQLINDVKGSEDILLACPQPRSTPSEFNDQEDDVDILRSPSPGQEMIKAEDNLVKIEPEDTSGTDDVKIDVEREESIAADDVMVTQLKQVYKEELITPIPAELVVNIVDLKQEHREEDDLKDKVNEDQRCFAKTETEVITTQGDANIKVEEKICDEILEPKPKRFKAEDSTSCQKTVIVKGEKGENVKNEHADDIIAPEKSFKTEECLKPDILSSEPVEGKEVSSSIENNNYNTTNAASSFLCADSATPPLPLTSQQIAAPSLTTQPLLQCNKTLSDDDIQARLHSFHKENILFLQSRNKKSKSSNSISSSSNCISAGAGEHHRHNKNQQQTHHLENKDRSEKVSGKHKNSSSSSVSSKKSKLHKRERTTSSSSSSNKNSTSQLFSTSTPTIPKTTVVNSSAIPLASTSLSTSGSSSKKVKSLKKSSSSSSTSSTNSLSSSNLQITYPPTTSDTEKHQRQRTTSGSSATITNSIATCSSTAHAAFTASKKRQLNFELELTKDMHLVNSVTTNSVKHKRLVEESQWHSSSKKSKKESLLIAKEDYKNGTNKLHKTSGATVHADKERKSTQIISSSAKTSVNSETVAHTVFTIPPSGVPHTDEVNSVLPITTPLAPLAATTTTTVVRDHPSLSHCNNVLLTPSTLIAMQSPSLLPQQTTGVLATAQTQPPPPAQNIPNHVNNTNFISPPPTQPQLPSTLAPGEMSSPVLTSGVNSTTHLPFYNTIYGKLLDSHTPSVACATPTPITPLTAAAPSPLSSSSAPTGSLSEYVDTKLKTYNTLGGYVSHTALFGLSNTQGKDSAALIPKDTANEMPAPQVPPVATASSSLTLSLSSSATPTTSPTVSTLKILTKTASHDPRLNPQLTAPEPPPQPKRKLSINEYRKRMQQSTSLESTGNSLASTPTTPPTLMEASTAAGVGAIINKCTLHSPERLAQSVDSQIQKEILSSSSLNVFDSLNSSNSSTSNSSLNESLLKSSSFMEEDSTKGQFNAAPTLLEKQQESLCARLKSLKEKQGLASALGVVGGGNRSRFSSFSESMGSGEFAVRKDDDDLDLLNSKRNLSISSSIGGGDLLDNCLEEISSTSTSMSSSREPSPERYTSTTHHHPSKHLLTASATTTVATTSSSICSASQAKGQQHHLNNSDKKTISAAELERKKSLDIA